MTIKNALENFGRGVKNEFEHQKLERRNRMANTEYVRQINELRTSMINNYKAAGENGLEAVTNIAVKGPFKFLFSSWMGKLGEVFEHNKDFNEDLAFLEKNKPSKEPKTLQELRHSRQYSRDLKAIEDQKMSYAQVPAAMVKALLTEWGRGALSTAKFVVNLSKALGKNTVLATRLTLGR